jgi:hypothetical protein
MTTPDFLIAVSYAVDQEMLDVPQHPEATLSPSSVVTLTLLPAIKGGGTRADLPLCPHVPERTRLVRFFKVYTVWTRRLLAAPTVLGVADTYRIALIHPCAQDAASPDGQPRAKQSVVESWRQALCGPELIECDLCLGRRHGEDGGQGGLQLGHCF